jgi:hypothetical protein
MAISTSATALGRQARNTGYPSSSRLSHNTGSTVSVGECCSAGLLLLDRRGDDPALTRVAPTDVRTREGRFLGHLDDLSPIGPRRPRANPYVESSVSHLVAAPQQAVGCAAVPTVGEAVWGNTMATVRFKAAS